MNEKCLKCVSEKSQDNYCWHDICERFGPEEVESFGNPQASYSFDEFRIWKRKTDGALFYGTDSGCSCLSPFEEERFETISSLSPITPNSWGAFKSDFENYAKHSLGEYDGGYRYLEPHKVTETLDAIRGMLYATEAA